MGSALSPNSRIPYFDGRLSFAAEWATLSGEIERVFDLGKFSDSTVTRELEDAIAGYTGARFAVAVDNCVDGIYIMLRAAGVGRDDEVIVPALHGRDAVLAVARVGAVPVVVDVEPDSYTIAAEAARRAITERTRALLTAHSFCQPADLRSLQEISTESGLLLLEVAPEGIGMRFGGRHVGCSGAAGVLAFPPAGLLAALGQAAVIVTDDAALAEEFVLLRHHGRSPDVPGRKAAVSGSAACSGLNSKVDEIQAAVLRARLPRLAALVERRAALAAKFTSGLAGVAQVRTPTIVPRTEPTVAVWQRYVIEVDARDVVAAELAGVGIETAALTLSAPDGPAPDCPNAAAAAARALALPFYPDLSDEQVEHICREIARIVAERLT
ncbi:DegT/DnrJ/EryC1/StrS family aminotransferase [Micromonospora chokoriensis]|uniref:DegT/DnrJ/EryC1/StrS family aminotransferase n=1 Tax=Micromonospora chokoriensis TaxID=356851 RepID=UPI00055CD40A|nr:DegT/DnrJ/EryC1/StrS family aminotransferase [Micromonospora chokoriensis]